MNGFNMEIAVCYKVSGFGDSRVSWHWRIQAVSYVGCYKLSLNESRNRHPSKPSTPV